MSDMLDKSTMLERIKEYRENGDDVVEYQVLGPMRKDILKRLGIAEDRLTDLVLLTERTCVLDDVEYCDIAITVVDEIAFTSDQFNDPQALN